MTVYAAASLTSAEPLLTAIVDSGDKIADVGLDLYKLDEGDLPRGDVLLTEKLADHASRGCTVVLAAPVDDPPVPFGARTPRARSTRLVLAYMRVRGCSASTRLTRHREEVGAA